MVNEPIFAGTIMTAQPLLAPTESILEKQTKTLSIKDSQLNEFDRRVDSLKNSEHYEKLSFAQKFGASRLTQYGYHLKFIRRSTTNTIAIFVCEERIATVDLIGEIDLSPKIRLRK
jgi:hypothetical protein